MEKVNHETKFSDAIDLQNRSAFSGEYLIIKYY